nr:hypothetical protein [uncultured Desulfobulbus sp.]
MACHFGDHLTFDKGAIGDDALANQFIFENNGKIRMFRKQGIFSELVRVQHVHILHEWLPNPRKAKTSEHAPAVYIEGSTLVVPAACDARMTKLRNKTHQQHT